MTSIVKGADAAIGRVVAEYQRLGLLNNTIFMVTADHGMAANRHIVPIHPMYQTVAAHAPGGTLDEEFRISMGSVWMRQPSEDRAVASALVAKHFPGVEGALYKVASGSGWVFTPDPSTVSRLGHNLAQAYVNLANTEASPAGPEVILPYAQDTLGLTLAKQKRWGQHGGFTWGVQHIPMTLAGPGIRHGLSHFPAKLVDVAPTLERLMGLPIPSGVDGVVLSDALSNATASERTAQKTAEGQRLPDVQAIRQHALAQTS
jgi:arylsulfatase A-like enzyme